jgi:hypothetical protein
MAVRLFRVEVSMDNASFIKPSVLERHPRTALACFFLAFLVLFAIAVEIVLKIQSGLGNPVLFYAHPSYGYRLKPHQETRRFGGAHFKINNLGLRAKDDWDANVEDKVLFLGDSVTYGGNNVGNEHLFSEIAVHGIPGVRTGNAGIPNWGVENVYGLVVQEQFLPAKVYVTTFIEDDFYRGLQQGRNKPWIKYEKPSLALEELAEFVWAKYFTDVQEVNRREREGVPPDVRVATAVKKLKAMDELLKARGYSHIIFMSPNRSQVLKRKPRDPAVNAELARHGIQAVYLLDKRRIAQATAEEADSWYLDYDHLTPKGHAVWGELMREELMRVLPKREALVES